MKKQFYFLHILLTLSTSAVVAQKSSAILRGGVNLANVSITSDGTADEANMLTSFQVGVIGDISVTSFLYIQPGIVFTGKGSKTQSGQPTDANYYKSEVNPYYIEIPVNVVLKAPIGGGAKFFAGAGPYVAIGVAGNRKLDYKIAGVSFSRKDKIEFSNDDPTTGGEEGAGFGILKRFDYGLNGTVGIEGKSVSISANYGLGLAKLQSGTTNGEDNNNKHRVLSFTIGFRL
ncbi:MAG: outer membrane beta-barrel protein [Chitinophagaceae bacterium]